MSLYGDYIKERENIDIVETDKYFFTYKLEDNDMTIFDIFIEKDSRGTGLSRELQKDIFNVARNNEIETMYGFTYVDTNGWEHSEKCMLHIGFIFDGQKENKRFYSLDLGEL